MPMSSKDRVAAYRARIKRDPPRYQALLAKEKERCKNRYKRKQERILQLPDNERKQLRQLNRDRVRKCRKMKKFQKLLCDGSEGKFGSLDNHSAISRALEKETSLCEQLQGKITTLQKKLKAKSIAYCRLMRKYKNLENEIQAIKEPLGIHSSEIEFEVNPTVSTYYGMACLWDHNYIKVEKPMADLLPIKTDEDTVKTIPKTDRQSRTATAKQLQTIENCQRPVDECIKKIKSHTNQSHCMLKNYNLTHNGSLVRALKWEDKLSAPTAGIANNADDSNMIDTSISISNLLNKIQQKIEKEDERVLKFM